VDFEIFLLSLCISQVNEAQSMRINKLERTSGISSLAGTGLETSGSSLSVVLLDVAFTLAGLEPSALDLVARSGST